MDQDAREKLRLSAIAALEGRLSSAELQAAVAGIEVSLTQLDDASLRRKLTGFESRLELVACFLPDDEGQEEFLRVAGELLQALEDT